MKRNDSIKKMPNAEDTLKIIIDNDLAVVIFQERNGSHHNDPGDSFEWNIQKEKQENFTGKDIGVFIEKELQEISEKNLVVRHIYDESFRVVEIPK
jgi:hypothetical protein